MKVITHRRRTGYSKYSYSKHSTTYTQVAYCGFKWTETAEDSVTWYMMPFSKESTCKECEDAYALEVLGELP